MTLNNAPLKPLHSVQAAKARTAAKIQQAQAQARRETAKSVRHKASLRLEAQLKLKGKSALSAAQLAYENANAEALIPSSISSLSSSPVAICPWVSSEPDCVLL